MNGSQRSGLDKLTTARNLHDQAQAVRVHERDYRGARLLYKQAFELAEAVGDRFLEVHNRVHCAECDIELGNLAAAADCLQPVVSGRHYRPGNEQKHDELTAAVSTLVTLSIDLPAPLPSIERALRRLEKLSLALDLKGKPIWRGSALLQRSRLAQARGEFEQARSFALESLGVEPTASGQAGLLLLLADICVELREADQAERYLQEWERRDAASRGEAPFHLSEVSRSQQIRSKAALLRGEMNEALRQARLSLDSASGGRVSHVLHTLLSAQLANNKLADARATLSRLLPDLKAARLADRLEVCVASAAYRRQADGGRSRRSRPDRTRTGARVSVWHNRAVSIADTLDSRLECCHHRSRVANLFEGL